MIAQHDCVTDVFDYVTRFFLDFFDFLFLFFDFLVKLCDYVARLWLACGSLTVYVARVARTEPHFSDFSTIFIDFAQYFALAA